MEIQCYTKDKTETSFNKFYIPDDLSKVQVNLQLNDGKNSSSGLGNINFTWDVDISQLKSDYCGEYLPSKSEYLNFYEIAYVTVNNKDKFVIKKEQDAYDLYKYFTGIDINLYLKHFQTLDKTNSIKDDF